MKILLLSIALCIASSTVLSQTDSVAGEISVHQVDGKPIVAAKKSYLWYYVAGVIGVGLIIMYYEHKKSNQ